MRDASIAVLREIGVETGGSNVQFARQSGRRAHGRHRDEPARVALLGAGLQGDRLPDRQGRGQARGRLHARRARQRHHRRRDAGLVRADHRLRRHQDPALRLREIPRRRARAHHLDEIGRRGDGDRPHLPGKRCRRRCARWRPASPASTRSPSTALGQGDDKNAIRAALGTPTPDRLLQVAQALRLGFDDERDPRRLHASIPGSCAQIARHRRRSRREVSAERPAGDAGALRRLKAMGFSDARLAKLAGLDGERGRGARAARSACARCSSASTPAPPSSPRPRAYMYSTYETAVRRPPPNARRARRTTKKIIILGGGPNRIGQGIEFDYCCCHAAFALREAGFETIMVNCNPETVSTDYDTSDRLYFEPLTPRTCSRSSTPSSRTARCTASSCSSAARRRSSSPQRAGGGRRADPRHLARRHRPRRGPRPLQAAARQARAAPAAERHRPLGRRRPRAIADEIGYPGRDPPVLRARRPRHGDRARRAQLDRYMRGSPRSTGRRARVSDKQPGADRPLSDRRDRGRRRLPSPTARTSSSAASWSTSRRPASTPATRACSLPPHSLTPTIIAELERQTARAGAGAQRRRADERAVRHQGRRRSTCSRSTRAPRAPCRSSPR